jgi:hypothetical protein
MFYHFVTSVATLLKNGVDVKRYFVYSLFVCGRNQEIEQRGTYIYGKVILRHPIVIFIRKLLHKPKITIVLTAVSYFQTQNIFRPQGAIIRYQQKCVEHISA